VAALSAPAISATRDAYRSVPSDLVRVAALVEISGAAAALARTIVKLHHLDPDLIAPHVKDTTDLYAVLGRGRWLPTMTRHVPAPAADPDLVAELAAVAPVPARRSTRLTAVRSAGQLPLFAPAVGEG